MKMRRIAVNSVSEPVRRDRDAVSVHRCFSILVLSLVLVLGFFYAAQAHFSAHERGMENAKLRQQKQQLQVEQQRLLVARESALSPAELEKAARKLGLQTITAKNIDRLDSSK
jgi:Tfp pilus assembly protein PilO